jgi:DNA polymerase III subunit delta
MAAKEGRAAAAGPTPQSVLKSLKKGEVEPLYWLFGAEHYLADRVLTALREAALKGSPRGFNLDVFLGKETSAAQILQAAKTLPMMAKRRLVIVKDASELKAAEQEPLANFIKDPVKETTLVFVSEKVDRRTKLFQAFSKAGLAVECKPLYEDRLPGWISDEARELGLQLAPEVPELLAQVVGGSLGPLRGALEKIALFVAPRREATTEEALEAVADTRARSAFELTAAIARRDLGAALLLLRRLTELERAGEAFIPLLGTIAWQWRQLIRGSILKARGLPKGEVVKEIGVFYRQADEFWATLARFEPRELRDKHEDILRADLALKSSPLSGGVILEGLLMRLCG